MRTEGKWSHSRKNRFQPAFLCLSYYAITIFAYANRSFIGKVHGAAPSMLATVFPSTDVIADSCSVLQYSRRLFLFFLSSRVLGFRVHHPLTTLDRSLRPGDMGVFGLQTGGSTGIRTPDLLLESQECNHCTTMNFLGRRFLYTVLYTPVTLANFRSVTLAKKYWLPSYW